MLVSLTFTEISTTIMLNLKPSPWIRLIRRHINPRRGLNRHSTSLTVGFILVASLSFVSACDAPPTPPLTLDSGPVARFLVEPPTRLLSLNDLYQVSEADEWSLRRQNEVDQWTFAPLPKTSNTTAEHSSTRQTTHAGLEIQQDVQMRRQVELEASTVHRLEVDLDPSMGRASLRLKWRRDDEAAVPLRRQLGAEAPSARNEQEQRYIFHLGRRIGWRGKIAELVLEVRPLKDRSRDQKPPRIRRLVQLERQLDRSALAEVAGQGVHVDLDHEVREAYLAPPGSAIVRQLDIDAGDRLNLAYGTEASVRSTITFRVVVGSSNGTDDSDGNLPKNVLWQGKVGPGNKPWGRWHEARVELGPHAGEGRRLRLETLIDVADNPGATRGETYDINQGFALWGHPEVLRPASAPSKQPPNVLFISLDTVRADRLSLYGHDRPTSPFLDAWAQSNAVVFEQAIAAAPWTLPSHMTLFSGLDALRHGINHDVGQSPNGKGRGFDLLSEILRRQGYDTAATTGGAYMHPKYGFGSGFTSYRYWNDRARDDDELTEGIDHALAFLAEERPRPFFYLFHTYAAHDPYEAQQPFFERVASPGVEAVEGEIALYSPPNEPQLAFHQQIHYELRQDGQKRVLDTSDRPLLEAFYDSGLARLDAELGRLLSGLEELGLDQNTVVVITSDHGENLLEANRPVGHLDLYDSNLRVPLIIAWPQGRSAGRGAGRRVAQQVRATDVLPTILASLGLPLPDAIDGVSLLPLVDALGGSEASRKTLTDLVPPDAWSYSASSNRGLSLRRGDSKLIINNNAWRPAIVDTSDIIPGGHELYELTEDMGEQSDVWAQIEAPSEEAADLRRRLVAYWQKHGQGLRLTVHHPGPGELVGQLKGPMVRPVATKSIDLDCQCLSWKEMGHATFRLSAGHSFTLQFEKVFGSRLEVSGHLQDGSLRDPFGHTFDADHLPKDGVLQWSTDRHWHTSDDGNDDSVPFLRLFWQGERRLAEESPSSSDPELRRQLEALGYL